MKNFILISLMILFFGGCDYGGYPITFDDDYQSPLSTSFDNSYKSPLIDWQSGFERQTWRTKPRFGTPNCDGVRDYPMTPQMYRWDRMHDPLMGQLSRPGDSLLGRSSRPGDSLWQ